MPIIIDRDDATSQPFDRVMSRSLINLETGATSLTINALTLEPGAQIPPHIHPSHEEAVLILEGEFEAQVGEEKCTLKPGDRILAPKKVRHHLVNIGAQPGHILAIFPTIRVERQMIE